MQTDIWLTQSVQPDQCPLCSKPLKASSKTCYACGFSLESPTSTSTNTNTASSVWIDPAVYTYKPSESTSTSDQPSKRSNVLPNASKPVGSVIWEGNEQSQDSHPSTQPQPHTRQRTSNPGIPSTGKHTSTPSKSIARPVHTRRRTYTRSLSQTQSGNPSARPSSPQPPMWQYESPNFEAGSSLPALSLLIAETPTQPGITRPEEDVQQSAESVGATFMAPQSDAYINPSPSIPSDDSWLLKDEEVESAIEAFEKHISISRHQSLFTDSPPPSASRTRLLTDSMDGTPIDEIDTLPPLTGKRSHRPPADDSFLIAGPSLISDALSTAESTGDVERDQSNFYQSGLQSSQAPTSHASIEEVDTVPEHLGVQFLAPSQDGIDHAPTPPAHLAEIDTAPDHLGVQFLAPATTPPTAPSSSRALVPISSQVTTIPATASSSWTAGGSARSGYARHIADQSRRTKRRSGLSLNPLDSVRWWLLRPGRIEFLLWLGGTILLISVTCVLLLVTAFSLNWITPGSQSSVTSSAPSLTSTSPKGHILPTVTNTPGLALTLLDKGPFVPGQSIHVHGQGFTRLGTVDFTLDSPQLPSNMPPISVQADRQGAFTTTLSLGDGLSQGLHLLIAHDMKTDSLAVVPFRVALADIGKRATATPPPAIPGTTVTPTSGQPGGGGNPATPTPPTIPTPVNSTPAPTPTPTKAPTPTSTPVPSTPTPTPTKAPTPTPTPVPPTPTPKPTSTAAVPTSPSPTATAIPTATASPTAAVPLSSDSGPGGGLSNALGNSNTPALSAQLTRLAPWLWLPMLFYILSMLMLGLAGALHKRRR